MRNIFHYFMIIGMFTLCCHFSAFGQQISDSVFHSLIPKHAIKVSYLHFYNQFPTAQFQYETYIGKENTLVIDIGPVLKVDQESSFRKQNKSGFKFRTGIRNYLYMKPKRRGGSYSTYLMPELLFNALNEQHYAYFKYPVDNDFYYKYEGYRRIHREGGLGFNFGMQRIFGSGICLDFNAGLAMWYLQTSHKGKPDAEMFENNDTSWFNILPKRGENRFTYMPLLGFRLGYLIK
ncbi:MAG: hypothetical protein ACFCUU_13185 [Cyclobacteriaceae bacterium]